MTFFKIDLDKRLWCKIDKDGPNGCWVWTACRNAKGYGRISDETGKVVLAHRLVYGLIVGKIPDKMQIDHTCYNKSCVNPDHLRICTSQQNRFNTPWNSSNTSGFRGASWSKSKKKWKAQICHNGRVKFLGHFSSAEEAHSAYREAAKDLYGEFACVQEALG